MAAPTRPLPPAAIRWTPDVLGMSWTPIGTLRIPVSLAVHAALRRVV